MIKESAIINAVNHLQQHDIVALPTESIYGLSSIITPKAISQIIALKKRPKEKGFIVLSGDINHLIPYIDVTNLKAEHLEKISQNATKRATTWICPVKKEYQWLTGKFDSIAIRLSTHPVLCEITKRMGEAIISTSANISSMPPAATANEIWQYFKGEVSYIYPESTQGASKPSRIIDLISGKVIRE
ncbi:L-threonylcarbamoyladenylate synthase [Fangia hongkongensis]|uniref:L-threonylcarbamoyladenylate synthase n=1 Tax=Fangia hongkongensis TaxID=270495 RepID=UPI000363476E|nr:L-threonylcarbamoyladenylate synthase [Fangia hongkongensis]